MTFILVNHGLCVAHKPLTKCHSAFVSQQVYYLSLNFLKTFPIKIEKRLGIVEYGEQSLTGMIHF